MPSRSAITVAGVYSLTNKQVDKLLQCADNEGIDYGVKIFKLDFVFSTLL